MAALAVVLFLLPARRAAAQDAPPSPWKRALELQGSLFVGNNPQTIFTTRSRLTYGDSTLEAGADVRFTYGESSADGVSVVAQRRWLAALNADLRPYSTVSPFFLGTFESSFERRIPERYSGGAGAKYTFVRSSETEVSLSLALLGERSVQLTPANVREQERLARYSSRFRARHKFNERVSVSHESFYQPEVAELDAYLFRSASSVGLKMTEILRLQLTYSDSYDSGALARGARSNYDGQLVVGILAEF